MKHGDSQGAVDADSSLCIQAACEVAKGGRLQQHLRARGLLPARYGLRQSLARPGRPQRCLQRSLV